MIKCENNREIMYRGGGISKWGIVILLFLTDGAGRGGRRVRDYIFRRDSTDVHWHILRSQLPRQGARFALDSSISLNDGSR